MTASATIAVAEPEKIGPGLLVLVVGPSGAGKDTLLGIAQTLLAGNDMVVFPRRVVTREPSAFENNLTITPDEFDQAVLADSFALSWRAHGQGYGLSHQIDRDIRDGLTVVANASRMVVAEARAKYKNAAVVLITAPAEVLAARLAGRQRPSDGAIEGRLQRAELADVVAPDATIANVGRAEQHGRELADLIATGLKQR